MRLVTTALLLALSTTIISAQKLSEKLVSLDVRVFGADDMAVTTLTRDDFSVYEGGQRQEIRSFESTETPFSVLLLVERSAEMQNDWLFLEPAMNRFLSALRPQDRVAIASFVDKPQMLMDWRNAREGQQVEVDLRPYRRQESFGGSSVAVTQNANGEMVRVAGSEVSFSSRPVETDFFGALAWAESQMQGIRTRKGVIVFSNGGFQFVLRQMRTVGQPHTVSTSDSKEFQRLLRTTEQAEVPIYFVTMGTDLNPRHAFPVGDVISPMLTRSRLQQLAETSGGNVAYPIKPEDVAPMYDQIARELGTTYTLTYSSTRTGESGASPRVDVRVRGDNLRVRQSVRGFPSVKTKAE